MINTLSNITYNKVNLWFKFGVLFGLIKMATGKRQKQRQLDELD
jgi:hypothetical protein